LRHQAFARDSAVNLIGQRPERQSKLRVHGARGSRHASCQQAGGPLAARTLRRAGRNE
jgi:hypothetical protein